MLCDFSTMDVSRQDRDCTSLSDLDLVRVIQSGGNAAFYRAAAEELFARYRKRVYLLCYRYVKSHERALDVSQDVLLRAYERLDSFDGRSEFSCWLFAIARNRCLNVLRSVSLWHDDGNDPELMPDSGAGPDRQVEEQEDEERILGMIRTVLDPIEQRALWLRCFEKVPVDEITELLGIKAASGARAVLQKARRKLRAAMGEG
jgi:RNA polymerase sigma-70 factor (ECF subfamily)